MTVGPTPSAWAARVHSLDAATRVGRCAAGWRASTHPGYWAFVGPFGGATAATVLNAVRSEPAAAGEPVALTVQFCAALTEGDYEIRPRLARANRSSQFWTAEVTQDPLGVACTAQVVLAERRPTWSAQPTEPPRPPDYATLAAYPTEGSTPWLRSYGFRFAEGAPSFDADGVRRPGDTRSVLWLHDMPERPVDALSLAAMSDAFFGRIFHALGAVVPFGTVSITTYFHATDAELTAAKVSRVIGRAWANRLHAGYQDQVGELWSPDGVLLATSHQLAYFRQPPAAGA